MTDFKRTNTSRRSVFGRRSGILSDENIQAGTVIEGNPVFFANMS